MLYVIYKLKTHLEVSKFVGVGTNLTAVGLKIR